MRNYKLSKHKKARNEQVIFRTREKTDRVSITLDTTNGTIHVPEADHNTMRVERSYERASGKPKVLSNVPAHQNSATLDVNTMLVKEYDYIMGIDTNTRIVNVQKFSICTYFFIMGEIQQFTDSGELPLSSGSFLICNPNEHINPERIGWYLSINHALKLPFDNGKGKLAVIVDSDKDHLPNINNQTKPYFQDNYLHKQLKFCYASDKDNDTLSGQLLKKCHISSSELMRNLTNEKITGLAKTETDFCDWYARL